MDLTFRLFAENKLRCQSESEESELDVDDDDDDDGNLPPALFLDLALASGLAVGWPPLGVATGWRLGLGLRWGGLGLGGWDLGWGGLDVRLRLFTEASGN